MTRVAPTASREAIRRAYRVGAERGQLSTGVDRALAQAAGPVAALAWSLCVVVSGAVPRKDFLYYVKARLRRARRPRRPPAGRRPAVANTAGLHPNRAITDGCSCLTLDATPG
jgi:hypothetical protein